MHNSYETKFSHPADFRVKYRFYSQAEGGRQALPFQGYRSDFWYENPEHTVSNVFMIWPEFENENGEIITDNHVFVPRQGTASMWIINPERRSYHYGKIIPGLTCYLMEGTRKVAECEVLDIIGLKTNPVMNNQT